MKSIFFKLMLILSIMTAIFALPQIADAATEGDYTYSVSGGEATVTDFPTTVSGKISIPDTLGGYKVTRIGSYAFNGCTSLKDLKIEDGTEILELGYNYYYSSGTGEGLFYDCPLETVYLGRNLSYNISCKYGYSPFYNQKALKTITIGKNTFNIL